MQVLLLLNTGLVIAGGLIKRLLVDRSSAAAPMEDFWNDIFDVNKTSSSALRTFSGCVSSISILHVLQEALCGHSEMMA